MRSDGKLYLHDVSKPQLCLTLKRSRHSTLGWRLRVEERMICCFGSTLDNPRGWTSWTVAGRTPDFFSSLTRGRGARPTVSAGRKRKSAATLDRTSPSSNRVAVLEPCERSVGVSERCTVPELHPANALRYLAREPLWHKRGLPVQPVCQSGANFRKLT
jgi:hypothetical protein